MGPIALTFHCLEFPLSVELWFGIVSHINLLSREPLLSGYFAASSRKEAKTETTSVQRLQGLRENHSRLFSPSFCVGLGNCWVSQRRSPIRWMSDSVYEFVHKQERLGLQRVRASENTTTEVYFSSIWKDHINDPGPLSARFSAFCRCPAPSLHGSRWVTRTPAFMYSFCLMEGGRSK